jgi:hypothetical protein
MKKLHPGGIRTLIFLFLWRMQWPLRHNVRPLCAIQYTYRQPEHFRYKELDRARVIFQRFVMCHPEVQNWIRWAKFEQKNGFVLKVQIQIKNPDLGLNCSLKILKIKLYFLLWKSFCKRTHQ